MKGLGPVNIGTEKWNEAMRKQERMEAYVKNLNTSQQRTTGKFSQGGKQPSRMMSDKDSKK